MAEPTKKGIAQAILSFLLGAATRGIGGGLVGGGMGAGLGGGIGGTAGILGSVAMPEAEGRAEYPQEFSPQYDHYYNVVAIPGAPNFNQHGKADASTIDQAGRMQTLEEHYDALTKYLRTLPPNATPRQMRDALNRGKQEEKNLPQFWNESKSRRPFSVSSSAVSGIRLSPDGRVEVSWQSNPAKWYTFRKYPNVQEASLAAQQLLKADSIGRAVYPVISHPPKNPNPALGEWNFQNYDPSYAE